MPILAALTTALPYITAAWQVGSQYLTKPKKEDYVPTGSMYQRYLAYLKSKTTESTVYHQRMRPALRQIGQQTQRGQRQVGYQVARQKPGGGIEAQMRMGINRQALEAIGIASEKASIAQEQVNVRTGEQLMRIGIQEEEALQRYKRDKQRFTQQMFRTAAYVGVNLANTAARKHIADAKIAAGAAKDAASAEQAIVKAYENAKAVGDFVGPLSEFKEGMDIADYTDPTAMAKFLATTRKQQEKDVKFQESEELKAIKASSTQAATQAYKLIADRPEGALEMLEESGYFRYMTDKDIQAVTKKAISEAPTPIDPLDVKITMASVTHNLKGLKNLLPQAVETGNIKRIEKVYKAYDAELNAAMETADEAKMQELTIEKGKMQVMFISGMYKSTYPNYKPGKKAEGEKFFKDTMTTIEGIKAKKGVALHEYNSAMKDYKNYLLTLDVDHPALTRALTIGDIIAAVKIAQSPVITTDPVQRAIGVTAKQIATLYVQFVKRMDALVKGELYEGATGVLDSLY